MHPRGVHALLQQPARAGRGVVHAAPMAPTDADLALLRRHAPRLHLDPLERFAPAAVDDFAALCATFDGGTRLAGAPADLGDRHGCPRRLHLNPEPEEPTTAGRGRALFARFAPTPGPADWRCYGDLVRLDGGGRVLRYWYFYVDNPFGLRRRDLGRHVADWESVLVELDAGGEIAAVIVFQHGSPQRVQAGEAPLEIADGRPHVYVAEGSHAIYLASGSQPRLLKRDNTSDEGWQGEPDVLPLPDAADAWASWCGRWGPDNGPELPRPVLAALRVVWRKSIGGDSPWGPLAARRSRVERDPAAAARAGNRQPINRISRRLFKIGERVWPNAVAFDGDAFVRDGVVHARVRSGGGPLRTARYVDAVVVDATGAAIGYDRRPLRGGRAAELSVRPLPGAGPPAEVRVAGYNRLDLRGDVLRRALAVG